jgi:hypothetical protein
MRRTLMHAHRVGVAALLIAVAATFLANCVYAAVPSPEEQACCAAMGDCGMPAQQHACCSADASAVQAGPIAKQLTVAAPDQTLEAVLTFAAPPHLESQRSRRSYGAVPKPPGVATYLLDSTFRI